MKVTVMRVRDVMTPNPITIDPEAPVGTALAIMREKGIRHLPVSDEARRLVGIITDRDLRSAVFTPLLGEHLSGGAVRRLRGLGESLEDLRIRDVMTWSVVTTHPDTPIPRAAVIMFTGRLGCLPVVQDERLVGILTERDLVRSLASLGSSRAVNVDALPW